MRQDGRLIQRSILFPENMRGWQFRVQGLFYTVTLGIYSIVACQIVGTGNYTQFIGLLLSSFAGFRQIVNYYRYICIFVYYLRATNIYLLGSTCVDTQLPE